MHFPIEQHEMVGLREAQRILNIGRSTMHDLIKSGRIPARKVGNEWRIRGKNLIDWMCCNQDEYFDEYGEETTVLAVAQSNDNSFFGDWT